MVELRPRRCQRIDCSGPRKNAPSGAFFLAAERLKNRRIRRVAVNLFRVEHLFRFFKLERVVAFAGGDGAVEAGAVADVAAGVAGDFDAEPDGVLVVIDAQFEHFLNEAAGRAFVPEHLARTAPVMGLAGTDGFLQRFLVHIAHHQHFAAVGGGGDADDQAVAVEFRGKVIAFFDLFDGEAFLEFDFSSHGGTHGSGEKTGAIIPQEHQFGADFRPYKGAEEYHARPK